MTKTLDPPLFLCGKNLILLACLSFEGVLYFRLKLEDLQTMTYIKRICIIQWCIKPFPHRCFSHETLSRNEIGTVWKMAKVFFFLFFIFILFYIKVYDFSCFVFFSFNITLSKGMDKSVHNPSTFSPFPFPSLHCFTLSSF